MSIDTLRWDHLSLYGYHRQTSPALDAWAERRGIVFADVVAASPWTLPSHVSMLTGVDALTHGVNHTQRVPDSLELLSERLGAEGYYAAAVTGGGFIHSDLGFGQGFDEFHAWGDKRKDPREWEQGVSQALNLLQRYGGGERPLFLFLHTYETHEPHRAREPFFDQFSRFDATGIEARLLQRPQRPDDGYSVEKQWALIDIERRTGGAVPPVLAGLPVDLYDSGVAAMDLQLGRLLDGLEDSGLADRTVVIVTSDHGEVLGEHGVAGHAYVWEENLRVPLVIAAPGILGGRRVEHPVRSIDLVPTILELVGVPVPDDLDGRSLVPLLRGGVGSDETAEAWIYAGKPNAWAAIRRAGRSKYVYRTQAWEGGPREALYDLGRDPREVEDVAGDEGVSVARERVFARLASMPTALRLTLGNASETPFSVVLEGEPVRVTTVKSADIPSGGDLARWDGTSATLVVPHLASYTIWIEGPGGAIELAVDELGRRRLELAIDPADGETITAARAEDGSWVVGGDAAVPKVGILIQGSSGAGLVDRGGPPEALLEQLKALGYVD